jgi:archaellum component FlaF (FlaF/FlaG flagellin family)
MKVLMMAGFLGSMALSGTVFGQYEKVFYTDTTFETDNYKVEIDNIVAAPKEVKFRMTITNKTNDWILYVPEEGKFEMGGKPLSFKEDKLLIPPYENKKRILKATGAGLNDARSFNFVCDGFHKVTLKEASKSPEFKLPISSNEFVSGNFKAVLVNSSKTSAKTEVKFNVTYNGEGLGFVSPAKISMRMPDGNVYATAKSKADVVAIEKGKTESITAAWSKMEGGSKNDMQMVEMWLIFNGVFQESAQLKAEKTIVPLRWNEAMTIGKK